MTLPDLDRTPPFSLEAEVAVLGAVLADPNAITDVMLAVRDIDFYREAHRRIYRAMIYCFEKGTTIDVLTLGDALKTTGEFDASGGWDQLSQLVDAVPSATNVEWHAGIVRDQARLRGLVEASAVTIRDVYDRGERTVSQVIDEAEARILTIASHTSDRGFIRLKDSLWETLAYLEAMQPGKPDDVVSTGFRELDSIFAGGVRKGDLTIVAARPSMGKTALCLGIAAHVGITDGRNVGVMSLEMSTEQLTTRLLGSLASVKSQPLRQGKLNPEEHARIAAAAAHMNTANIFIDDNPGQTITEVRAKARRLKSREGADLIIVDYLQLLEGSKPGQTRVNEIGEISRGLKRLARELDLPVIALSQLSRAVEGRPDKRPMLSDLRESGSLEQDADNVVFLYRPEYYMKPGRAQEKGLEGVAEVLVSKQRNGPVGSLYLYFEKEYARFTNREIRRLARTTEAR